MNDATFTDRSAAGRGPGRWPLLALLLWTAVVVATGGGCVRRRLTVLTNVPGAQVYVDNQDIGKTPVSTPFLYYGTREIRVVKDGFETVSVKRTFDPPWYQYPPLDFISENLWPWELRDEHVVNFQLPPQRMVPLAELQQRAQQLRQNARQGVATPLLSAPAGIAPQPPAGFVPPETLPSPQPAFRLPPTGQLPPAQRPPAQLTPGSSGGPVYPAPVSPVR